MASRARKEPQRHSSASPATSIDGLSARDVRRYSHNGIGCISAQAGRGTEAVTKSKLTLPRLKPGDSWFIEDACFPPWRAESRGTPLPKRSP